MSLPPPSRVAIECGPQDYVDPDAVQAAVDGALARLGLPDDFVRPGDRVVLKPNWVKDVHERRPGPDGWIPIVTHPSVIRAVARWMARRLGGRGSVTICDAPQRDSSFDALRRLCGLDALLASLAAEFPTIEFAMFDLRIEEFESREGVFVARRELPGDPAGATTVHLDEASELIGHPGQGRFYGAHYDVAETNRQHRDPHHEYRLARTPLEADVFVNLPKLKTHKKVGITVALKNLVGITETTNWLPRHTEGTPETGGDQFPSSTSRTRLERRVMAPVRLLFGRRYGLARLLVPFKRVATLYFGDTEKTVRAGNWHGNDTAWRMILDLNKCLTFFDAEGRRRERPLRQLVVVDGIVAGEGDGPMLPDPRPCGVVLAGANPVAVDCVAATLMGFDWRRIRLLARAFEMTRLSFVDFRPEDVEIASAHAPWAGGLADLEDDFGFRPHFGWRGAIERHAPR